MDLAMPHPAVTRTNQAVSETYLFSLIRGYKQCKNTDEELCKAANAVLSPGCCSSGWSQCAHTFLSCCDFHAARGTATFPPWTWGLGFLSEGTGMGLFHSWISTQELEQHHSSSGITRDDLLLSKSSQEAHQLQWHWQLPGALAERFLPTGPVCSPWSTAVQVDQSQVVCIVLFCWQVQSKFRAA